ncbi:4-carboxy-4-hydroxy-2-oxoadipate aldolase/oxaloacetate decarboxylase [Ramlibacter sp. G-1-2-2]|uniref:4-carboxy-4-hydroxy-2-oxoadipate aldolase/oxaloacetate decarboxylase n=1 Tax=Ramlibacter agri TaxID=2728837 RepID=A0A848HDK9_9BURK|nr:4-carboxy-4-hydroxy-2-oxoadipate aldolase/oxaloacetate decarboxylase [Ramlibacter agri]NML47441.1 4-carboxy-4-hydroxy-2-oxoadipate aldolase/oxaloacetate decarboxylase [Ramlibacter agri]
MNASKVYLKVQRVAADIARQAREVTVADIHEAMGPQGRGALMGARMRPLSEGQQRIAGPAVTAFCWPGDNLMMHRALYLAQPGDVLVVVCQSELSGAQWGDLACRYAMQKGLAGVVVQGCVRDIDQVRAFGFPVWSTHIWPMHPDKSGHGSVNAPVVCEGVNVRPGDLIVADGDAVICVPRDEAAQVLAAAQAKMRREDEVAEKVRAGGSVWELSGAAASYAKLGIEEVNAAWDE